MKQTFKLMGAAVLGAVVLFGANSCNSSSKPAENTVEQPAENVNLAPAGSIVYIDMTKLMAEYQMAIDLSKDVEAKLEELTKAFDNKKTAAEKEITRKQSSFQTKYNDFQPTFSCSFCGDYERCNCGCRVLREHVCIWLCVQLHSVASAQGGCFSHFRNGIDED